MSRSRITLLAVCVLVASSCGDSAPSDIAGPPQQPAPAAPAMRIEIDPGAVLLPGAGASQQLTINAYDAQGQPTTATVTWRSSSSAVSVSSGGTVTAVAIGAATIEAEAANGVKSPPIVVLVARPTPGALLVSDAQVVGGLVQVDPPEEFTSVGWKYQVVLRNVTAPSPGTIVLASGGAPVAGRVVSVAPSGSNIAVTLALVPLTELFEQLQFRLQMPFVADPAAPTASVLATPVPARPTLVTPSGPTMDEIEIAFGPVKCKATASIPLSLENMNGSYTGSLNGIIEFSDEVMRLGVAGSLSGQLTARPMLGGAFTGGVKCELNIPRKALTFPIGGPLAMFYGLQLQPGIGVQLKGAVAVPQVGFDLTAQAGAQLQVTYECTAPTWICGFTSSLTPSSDGSLKVVLPDLGDTRVELAGRGYVYAKLQFGPNNPLLLRAAAFLLEPGEELTVKIAEANLGLEQTIDVAAGRRQAMDPTYAANAELRVTAEAGLDVELKLGWEEFGRKLGYVMQVADVPLWADTLVLSQSPRGTFQVSPTSVKAGNDSTLGELVTFTFALDPVTYLGSYSVDRVEVRWLKTDGTTVTLENGRPPCTTLTPTANGQSQFSCQVDFLEEHAGPQTFVGFVYPRLFGVALPVPFEVAPDTRRTVQVTVNEAECFAPPEDLQPMIVDNTSFFGDSAQVTHSLSLSHQSATVEATTTGTTSNVAHWSPSVHLSALAVDYLWIVPLEGNPDRLWAIVHHVGRAEAEIVGGTCCGSGTDGEAELTMFGTWLGTGLPLLKAEAGASFSGNLPRYDVEEVDETRRVLAWRNPAVFGGVQTWAGTEISVEGRIRHRGANNSAIVRGNLQVTILDMVDDDDNSVPVLICSAAGINYGVPASASRQPSSGGFASRPLRQAGPSQRAR